MSTMEVPHPMGRVLQVARDERRDKHVDSGYLIESIEYVSPTALPLNAKLRQPEARNRLLARTRQRIKDRADSLANDGEIT